jgi:ketosteroid isomerase-like protein
MQEVEAMRTLATFVTLIAAASVACHDATGPADDVLRAGATPSLSSEGTEASNRAHLDLRAERASLTAAGDALSDAIQQDGLVPALGAAFADDVLFLSPRVATIQGSVAATTFLTTNALAPTDMRWQVIIAQVSSDATQGYTWASGFFTIDFGGGASELPGFFLIYWRRTPGGDWQVAAMVFNLRALDGQTIPAGFGTRTTKHRRYFPNTDAAEQRAQVLAVDAEFSATSVSQSSGPAFEAFAAPNAIGVGGGQLIFGPQAIGEAFSVGPNDVISWVPRFSDVAATGDLGFTVGDATFVFPEFGIFFSKYLTVWEKQNTGEWKFVADFGSSRPGP